LCLKSDDCKTITGFGEYSFFKWNKSSGIPHRYSYLDAFIDDKFEKPELNMFMFQDGDIKCTTVYIKNNAADLNL
jgi:hypothetical protein